MRGECVGRARGVRGACVGRAQGLYWKLGWEACVECAWGVRGVCMGRVCGNKCWYRLLRFIIRIPW